MWYQWIAVQCPLASPAPPHHWLRRRPPTTTVPAGSPTATDGLPVAVWELPAGGIIASPLWYLHLPSEEVALAVAAQAVLLHFLVEPWGEGASWEELFAAVNSYPEEQRGRFAAEDQSFRVRVEAWGRKVSSDEQLDIIESLQGCTRFRGRVDLDAPDHKFMAILSGKNSSANLPPLPQRFYFGEQVAVGDRAMMAKFDLKQRRYLGPTSMNHELAFIMCAMAGVRRSSLVLDPFVGTGSLLVAAAQRGALTLGTDIDIRVIRIGKRDAAGRAVNVWTNFADYGLPPPLGLLRCDLHTLPLRTGLEAAIDAIVADPPYGVRAGGRKSQHKDLVIQDRATHIPSTAPYPLAECLRDLVGAAARLLVEGGRVVFWVPCAPGFYAEDELPTHPAMAVVANCEQKLAGRYSRRLVVMRKERPYDAAAEAAHYESIGPPVMAQDSLHDMVFAPKPKGRRGEGSSRGDAASVPDS